MDLVRLVVQMSHYLLANIWHSQNGGSVTLPGSHYPKLSDLLCMAQAALSISPLLLLSPRKAMYKNISKEIMYKVWGVYLFNTIGSCIFSYLHPWAISLGCWEWWTITSGLTSWRLSMERMEEMLWGHCVLLFRRLWGWMRKTSMNAWTGLTCVRDLDLLDISSLTWFLSIQQR